jgi:hypothetical protein
MMSINLLKLRFSHIDYKMVKKTSMKLKHLNAKGHNFIKVFGLKTPFKCLIVFISNIIFINISSLILKFTFGMCSMKTCFLLH